MKSRSRLFCRSCCLSPCKLNGIGLLRPLFTSFSLHSSPQRRLWALCIVSGVIFTHSSAIYVAIGQSARLYLVFTPQPSWSTPPPRFLRRSSTGHVVLVLTCRSSPAWSTLPPGGGPGSLVDVIHQPAEKMTSSSTPVIRRGISHHLAIARHPAWTMLPPRPRPRYLTGTGYDAVAVRSLTGANNATTSSSFSLFDRGGAHCHLVLIFILQPAWSALPPRSGSCSSTKATNSSSLVVRYSHGV